MGAALVILNVLAAAVAAVAAGIGAVRGTTSTRPLWGAFAGLAVLNVIGGAVLLATGATLAAAGGFYASLAVPEWLLAAAGALRSVRTHRRVMAATGQLEHLAVTLGGVTE